MGRWAWAEPACIPICERRGRFRFLDRQSDGTLFRMAASMYIVVEGEDPGYNIYVNGRMLARHEDSLERLAQRLGVKPLLEFFSADVNSMSVLIEESGGNADALPALMPPQWYPPDDGLRTVRALIEALDDEPQQMGSEGGQILIELREYENVLAKTAQKGLRWHLAVSWR
jgi:hypothetical protein